jgi:hypothetical protein
MIATEVLMAVTVVVGGWWLGVGGWWTKVREGGGKNKEKKNDRWKFFRFSNSIYYNLRT